MTYEEAIDEIKTEYFSNHYCFKPQLPRALEMAIEALEKQIPKQPTYEADGYANGELVYDTWYCPNCEKNYEVGYDDYDYCPCCGQRIDRSEVEECF